MHRPINAEERIAARFIPSGYIEARREGSSVVYIDPSGLHGIAFRGSSMNSEWHYKFKSPEQRDRTIAEFFAGIVAHEEYKKERKARRQKPEERDTFKVKKALQAAGYNVASVKHGTGTASHWIEIRLDDYREIFDGNGYRVDRYGDVMGIAKMASGREHLEDDIQTDLFMVNILVDFTKRYKCKECASYPCDRPQYMSDDPEQSACPIFETPAAYQARQDRYNAEQPAEQPAEPPRAEIVPARFPASPCNRYGYLNVSIEEVPAE